MHSGITGITDIAYNQTNSTIIILDNSITGMTGHQQNPTTGKNLRGEPAGKVDLEALCRAVGFRRVRVVDPNNLKEMDKALKEELAAEEPSVIITLRDAQGGPQGSASEGRPGKVQRMQPLHADRLPRPQSPRGPRGNRQHPVHWLPGVHADVPPGRFDRIRRKRTWKLSTL